MKKWTKTILVTVLTVMLLLSCTATAWADTNIGRDTNSNFTNSGDTANDGIATFNLIKDYDLDNAGGSSPAETFTFTISPYAVWNAGSGITANTMPMLQGTSGTTAAGATLTLNVATAKGDAAVSASPESYSADKFATVNLPNYTTVGDYWYKVDETAGSTTGVVYNSSSYYIHVQVTQAASGLVRNVTMHMTCPDTSTVNANYNVATLGTKLNAIENRYQAGTLTVTKTVTGNAGDKTKYFPVTVVFTKAAGTIVNSDITFEAVLDPATSTANAAVTIQGQHYSGIVDSTNIVWKTTSNINIQAPPTSTDALTATATIYVKDGTSVTFNNIPYGVTYTVTESLDANDNYTNSFAFDATESGDTTTTGSATGSISDASDTLTITNNKETTIDIGVITDDLPFITMIAVAGAALILLVIRKRKATEV